MKTRLKFSTRILGLAAVVCAASLAWAQEYSHVRIVRLSFEEGTVNLARPNVPGVTQASANMPIQEGYVLSTQEGSFAEVEFENTSTARVGQLSQLVFNQLALDANGNKLNGMELQQGYATFTVYPENNDVYQVRAGTLTITPDYDKGTRFRVDVDGANARVEVFKGSVDVSGSFGMERVSKNTSLEFDPSNDAEAHITHGLTKDAWDKWVEQREQEAQLARRKSPPSYYTNDVSSYLYGWNDLYYYGSWNYIPGYGSCWIPTMSSGWVPFSYGQWVWYPDLGYTWISFEPWGWIPYHYGNWIYETGYGWAWVPGGFGAWTPAPVSWYQGQTWVAWSPRPLRPRPGAGIVPHRGACPEQGCTTMETTNAFRAGTPVRGHRPWVNVSDANSVETPRIAPPERGRPAFSSTDARNPGGMRSPSSPGARINYGAAADSTDGRIVYDPRSGGFVNGRDGNTAAPTRVESPAPLRGAPAGASPDQEQFPARSPRPLRGGNSAVSSPSPAPMANHHASPRIAPEPPHSGDSTFERALSTWGSGGSSNSGYSRGNSGSWSAPSSSRGSWSGGSSGSSSVSAPRSSGGGGFSRSVGGGGGGGHTVSSPRSSSPPRQ